MGIPPTQKKKAGGISGRSAQGKTDSLLTKAIQLKSIVLASGNGVPLFKGT